MRPTYPDSGRITAALPGRAPGRDVAIVGMSCLFPQAPDLATFWQNIVAGVDAISDPPEGAWEAETFFDPASGATDRVYCRRGGYLGDLARFDPLAHGVMPLALRGGEPEQWLALQLARDALADAGYAGRPKEWQSAAVVLGKSNYVNRGSLGLVQHGLMVEQIMQVLCALGDRYSEDDLAAIRRELREALPPLTAETAPAYVPNIIAGRIANRLDLMGPSYTVDAGGASALLAVQLAVRYLLAGQCDLALVGGAQLAGAIPTATLFCQLNALSHRQQPRPFDADADGMVLGEGIGMVVLKRREDAERDGDRIYAVIKGVGTSSDGAEMSALAPSHAGLALALRRAYAMGDISPQSVELIEAAAGGVPEADRAEIAALHEVLGARAGLYPHCGLGTVKSMIGDALAAAGMAGLIKAALALYHQTLPPTLHAETPHPALEQEQTPFYLSSAARPWVHGARETPRRAGVSATGLGASVHAALEEYTGPAAHDRGELSWRWESEVCIVRAESYEQLARRLATVESFVAEHPSAALKDVAYTLNTGAEAGPWRVAVVAMSLDDLREKLGRARQRLAAPGCESIKDVRGIYFTAQPLGPRGKLALLFPGEGAQYVTMLADLCLHFPEVRACFDQIDRVYLDHPRGYLPSDVIFPPPARNAGEQVAAQRRLWQMDNAMEAVLTANHALHLLLTRLGLRPDVIVGHSTGEYAALRAAGILDLGDEAVYARFLQALNRCYEAETAGDGVPRAALLAIGAERSQAAEIIAASGGALYVAMDNCPHQTIVAGHEPAVRRAGELARARGLICEALPYDRAYHTPLFRAYARKFMRVYAGLPLSVPAIDIYSCTTMAPFPRDPAAIRRLALLEQWVRPVEFRGTVEALYDAGVRLFVECGPKGNLTAFVDDILVERPHLAVASNVARRSGLTSLHHMVAQLAAHGAPLALEYLYERRTPLRLPIDGGEGAPAPAPSATWPLETGWSMPRLSPDLTRRLLHTSHASERVETAPEVASPPDSTPVAPPDIAPVVLSEGTPALAAPELTLSDVPPQRPGQRGEQDTAETEASRATEVSLSPAPSSSSDALAAWPSAPLIELPVATAEASSAAMDAPVGQHEASGGALVPVHGGAEASAAPLGAVAVSGAAVAAMHAYLSTMDDFVATQEGLMRAYLDAARRRHGAVVIGGAESGRAAHGSIVVEGTSAAQGHGMVERDGSGESDDERESGAT